MTRRSKRELERALDDLDAGGDRPAGLITILSTGANGGEVELVDPERRLALVDGETRQLTPNAFDRLVGGGLQ